jgi:hypothetical protein
MTERELPKNNPAKRLLEILRRASHSPRGERIERVLGNAMEIERSNNSFYQGFVRLFELLDKVESNLKYISQIKSKNYRTLIQDIREKLVLLGMQGFQEQERLWESVGELNNPHWIDLHFLENCAEEFEERKVFLTPAILSELNSELNSWKKEFEDSDLTDEFKTVLSEKLLESLDTVENHYAYGSAGLKKEIEASMTEITLAEDAIATPQEKSYWVGKFYRLFRRIDLFLDLKIQLKSLIPVELVETVPADIHYWQKY